MPTDPIVGLCHEYARLECEARKQPELGSIFRDSARHLYHISPDEAYPHLDAVKKVLETDRDVINPELVLLRLGDRAMNIEEIDEMADTMLECADRAEVHRIGDTIVAMFTGHNAATIEAALAYALAGVLAGFPSEEVPKVAILAAISRLALRIERELDLETEQ